MIRIKCFGIAKDIVKNETTMIDTDSISVADLRSTLNTKYQEFSKINGYMITVNQEYAGDETVIHSEDEVAILPPVSGG